MCIDCFVARLNETKFEKLSYYPYNGKIPYIFIKVDQINGSIYNGDAFFYLSRDNKEWSSPIETDSIRKDIAWMNIYVGYVDELSPKVKDWLINNGPLPIREN